MRCACSRTPSSGLSFIHHHLRRPGQRYFARQQVVERLREVDLPDGAQPSLAPFSTPIGEIYRYRLKSDSWARGMRSIEAGLSSGAATDPGSRTL